MTRPLRTREVLATVAPHDWPWAEAHAGGIAGHWARRVAERPAMFNGRVLMLSALEGDEERVAARFFETDYANLIAWLDLGRPDPSVSNGFAMGALQGADGRFILGRMADHTANAGHLYFPAGTPDPGDVTPDGVVDLTGSILREIEEETGLAPTELDLAPDWTITTGDGQVAFLREARLSVPAEDACRRIRRFLASQQRPELSDVEIVDPDRAFDPALPCYLRGFLRARAAQTS